MALAEFKAHLLVGVLSPLLGRAIGVAFLVPYVVFAVRRRIPPGYAWPLAGIFVLGGLQGLVGWLMVAERARRRSAGFAVPAHPASGAGVRDFRRDAVDRAVARIPAQQRTRRARHAGDCADSPSPSRRWCSSW